MTVVRSVPAMQRQSDRLRRRGRTIALVPTMGFLHDGHLDLVRRARREADYVVVSVFVNPIQFGPHEDFQRYPRDFARDWRLLKAAGADCIFAPGARAMYASGFSTHVDVEGLTRGMCGASRPGHFRGVATVVAKLFNITRPHLAVFGAKDFQQARVIERMVRDLNYGIRVIVVPTRREPDGLAMSSRNRYLGPEHRRKAVVLYQALGLASLLVGRGVRDPRRILPRMRAWLRRAGARVDYCVLVDPKTLVPVTRIRGPVLAAIAAFIGQTRLIDSAVLRPSR